jgi:hypothetical protein
MNELLVINNWYVGIIYDMTRLDEFLEQTYCVCIN